MSGPRQHHFCPKFYLEYFADIEGFVWVFPKDPKGKIYKSKPPKIARQRDFYALEAPSGEDPNLLEKEFSEIEGKAQCVIKKILIEQKPLKTFLTEDELGSLLSFVALLSTRTPPIRKWVNDAFNRLSQLLGSAILATKERFLDTAKKAGMTEIKEEDFPRFKRFHQEAKHQINPPKNFLLLEILKQTETITNCLLPRNWILGKSGKYKFITCDHPVSLSWIDPIYPNRPPGFGLQNTQVIFPLTPKLCLIGVFEKFSSDILQLDDEDVPIINAKILHQASDFLYSSEKELTWMKPNRKVGQLAEYLKFRGN